MEKDRIIIGDAVQGLRTLPEKCVDMCVTSPPYYGLRDYGEDGQIGLENTPEEFIERLVEVFREVKRVMKDDGTLWLNIGDSYWGSGSRGFDFTDKFTEKSKVQQGSKGTIDLHNVPKLIGNYKDIKNKDLIGIPWMLAFALRADGWYLRQDIIWHKPNPMPESVTDRCTKSHEYFFLLSKSPRYYFDYKAISEQAAYDGRKDTTNKGSEKYASAAIFPQGKTNTCQSVPHERWRWEDGVPMRNKRDVWSVATKPYSGAHFATYPEELITPCILAGSARGGLVLDPFFGAGTTGVVAKKLGRYYIGTELNPEYAELAKNRIDYETDADQIRMFEEVV